VIKTQTINEGASMRTVNRESIFRNKRNAICFGVFIACLVLLPLSSLAADDGYGYPIPGSYEATILGTPAKLIPEFPANMRTRQLVLDVIPDRQKPPIFFYDKGLHCTFAYQKQKAPLVFLIAGAGASDRAPKLLTMMKALYQAGFHVITLPSPTNSNFIISASQSRVPGDLTEDAADLYRAMETAWNEVKGDIEVSDFLLCGYSLGATQAAFVAKLDEERRIFNFRKVLMIDPTVSLYGSVTRIEDMLKEIPGGPNKQGIFFNRMLSRFSEYYSYGNFVAINDEFLYAIYVDRLYSKEETAGLIGLTFRINLAGMIFTSDVMTNSGYVVPKNRVLSPTDSLFDYFLVSSHLSFFDYFNEYFYPYCLTRHPGLTKQALIESLSLRSIEGYLKSTAKFGVMANENDFIITKSELDYLREIFGERAKIYPRGGHLGNIEYKENLAYMTAFFK
jgi:pimeloyl-ACP methyl ester carboxylesterase